MPTSHRLVFYHQKTHLSSIIAFFLLKSCIFRRINFRQRAQKHRQHGIAHRHIYRCIFLKHRLQHIILRRFAADLFPPDIGYGSNAHRSVVDLILYRKHFLPSFLRRPCSRVPWFMRPLFPSVSRGYPPVFMPQESLSARIVYHKWKKKEQKIFPKKQIFPFPRALSAESAYFRASGRRISNTAPRSPFCASIDPWWRWMISAASAKPIPVLPFSPV